MNQRMRVQVGATPAKVVLVCLLACVLLAVIVANRQSASAEGETAALPASLNEGASSIHPLAPADPAGSDKWQSHFGEFAYEEVWPEAPLSEATKVDPLAAPSWAIAHEQSEEKFDEAQIKELFASQNTIIFMSGRRRIARVGTQEFEVGDTIGQFKITDISAHGVALSEIE